MLALPFPGVGSMSQSPMYSALPGRGPNAAGTSPDPSTQCPAIRLNQISEVAQYAGRVTHCGTSGSCPTCLFTVKDGHLRGRWKSNVVDKRRFLCHCLEADGVLAPRGVFHERNSAIRGQSKRGCERFSDGWASWIPGTEPCLIFHFLLTLSGQENRTSPCASHR